MAPAKNTKTAKETKASGRSVPGKNHNGRAAAQGLGWEDLRRRLRQHALRPQGKEWTLEDFTQASEALLDQLQNAGEIVSYQALETWWREWLALDADQNPLLPRKIAAEFFDLSTGPLTFGSRIRIAEAVVERRQVPAHDAHVVPSPAQQAFLAPESLNGANALDEFAEHFACGANQDGVFLLAGVRGSGKSTLLNRIGSYGRSWRREKRQWSAPLLVRTDIGTSFEERKFTIDLASQICQDAMRRFKDRPYCASFPSRLAVMGVGGFGRWCSSNLRWAAMALFLLLFIALATGFHRSRVRQSLKEVAATRQQEVDSISGDQDTARRVTTELLLRHRPPMTDELSSQMRLLVGLLVGMTLVGMTFEGRRRRVVPPLGPGSGGLWLARFFYGGIVFLALGWLGFVIKDLMVSKVPDWPAAVAQELTLRWHLVIACIGLVAWIIVCVSAVPRWYFVYSYCKKLFLSLRARQDDSAPDLPYLTNFTTLIRPLLPQGDDGEPLEELSVPMLQDQFRRMLQRCVAGFGRVIVLIDDVDVLPSEKFHELMRIIRPMTKVPGVRCLISVPEYFYHQFHSSRLGDLHSTVRDVFFLGDPTIFWGHKEMFRARVEPQEAKKPALGDDYLQAAEFLAFIGRLILSRLRIKVHLPREVGEIQWVGNGAQAGRSVERSLLEQDSAEADGEQMEIVLPGLFDFVLDPWRVMAKDWGTWRLRSVAPFLREVGHSRREWIREIEKTLAQLRIDDRGKVSGSYIPLERSAPDTGREEWSKIANDKKDEYGREESSLVARRTAPKDQPLTVTIRPDPVLKLMQAS